MSPELFLWILAGVSGGIVIGAIPGLTGAMAIALTLPLTFSLGAEAALALLVSMYVGSVSGGLITATLLKIPGTPASIVTTLDAYPMASGGKPRRALGWGIGASLVGGLISWAVLVSLARPMAGLALRLSSFDFFALTVLALVFVAAISRGQLLSGLFSASFGILAAMPGIDPATGQIRLTGGIPGLEDGLKLLPVLIGLFAVSEAIRLAGTRPGGEEARLSGAGGSGPRWREWWGQGPNLIRSSMIGSFVGVLPGIGANIGSLLAYGAAKAVAPDRERFGEGADSGIVASEAANNATVGGALVPLIALGIPGSVIDAILLGAFVIHGLQPGPMLFQDRPEIVGVITGSYLIANLVMFALMRMGVGTLRRLAGVPRRYLIPAILVFSVVGSYALANRVFDVWVMLIFGGIGLLFSLCRIPLAPFVLGFVLGPLLEERLVTGLSASGGDWSPLFRSPLSASLLVVALAVLAASLWPRKAGSPTPSASA